ncbi:extracellular solute-binding protein [Devosia sp. MC521]|uniref:extracellular solute-binding protein n=1 Tax=Devosia sp. MC521 TaxID=2759954 RepID=UPI0015FD1E7E|nr:extracellular solute-binding protein [Devosia sp. MC521]MBJ6987616.1 ABC transporter substrate-binding protein [Devosia sp. MC521]QMW61967.1 ABC transporter substrate-binding protein [Devosia sp. MC521]
MTSTRRLLSLTLAAALSLSTSALALAETVTGAWTHAFTMGDAAKYPADFKHFDYVNPDAPKAGTLRLGTRGAFDTFNPILPKGDPAAGLGLTYDTLMTPSLDENNTYYGHLAKELFIEPDYSAVTFRLDPDAKWHDGEKVTAADVVWTFEKMIELSPNQAQYYASVTNAEALTDGEVKFTFNEKNNRELPLILGQLLVLPQHWWEGTDAKGNKRDIGASTQEPPLGSGAYKLQSFDAGKTITYERVPDYWAATKPTELGQNNFDTLAYEYFLDESVWFEGFKGDQFDYWSEYSARRWATGFDFPAVEEGRVVLETFAQDYNASGAMTGFIPNLRRDKFQDEKVREALNYAFDFEELNRTVFFEQYDRINSYFFGLPFASKDLPQGEELEILESVKDLIPASVFTEVYTNPVAGDSQKLRGNLRTALGLLTEAGYTLQGNQLVDANGKQLEIELLMHQASLEPIAQNMITNLRQIGVAMTLRIVDTPQYINRLRSFDYDMIYTSWAQSFSPGNEQRFFFGTGSADAEGSQNYLGLADKGVDAIIEKLIAADDRATQEAASAALDRVLLHKHLVVPGYALQYSRTARWNRFSHPETLPEFSSGFPTIWWWDEEKATQTK